MANDPSVTPMLFNTQTTDLNNADGVYSRARSGKAGELFVADANPRYYDMVRRGNVWTCSNQAAVALSLNSATATGFILTNPPNSGKLLVLMEVCVSLATAPAGAAPLVLTGDASGAAAVTHTTPITTKKNAFLGGGAGTGVALIDSAATIPASPTIFRTFGGGPVAASSITPPFIKDPVDGALILGQGTVISVQCLTTAISVVVSMTWGEVPA